MYGPWVISGVCLTDEHLSVVCIIDWYFIDAYMTNAYLPVIHLTDSDMYYVIGMYITGIYCILLVHT